jgi:hypothetical protein
MAPSAAADPRLDCEDAAQPPPPESDLFELAPDCANEPETDEPETDEPDVLVEPDPAEPD